MAQTRLVPQANRERLDREIEKEESLDLRRETASKCGSRMDEARRLAWAGVKLGNCMLQRWLNVCEVGVEEVFFALTMLRSFAGVTLEPATAPEARGAFYSGSLLDEGDSIGPGGSSNVSWSQPNTTISWRTPWLYLVLVLLFWLLLF